MFNWLVNSVLKLCFACMLLSASSSLAQVGINTVMPLSTLDINGNLSIKTIGITIPFLGGSSGNATLITDGIYISLTPIAGKIEFIVPNAVVVPGRIYYLRNISNSISAQLYSLGGLFFAKDSNTATTAPLIMPANAQGKTIVLISDGANWTYMF